MASHSARHHRPAKPEPRWPAVLVFVAMGGLNLSLPDPLRPGPSWLLLALVGVLLVPAVATHRLGQTRVNHAIGLLLCGVITLALMFSLSALIAGLPAHREHPTVLLRSAAAIWISNILVFASWYWRLDAGGPHVREMRDSHIDGAFLFPQMALHEPTLERKELWRPGFIDYLFLAFNTSTALSPTDVPVLSRWAKLLMMIQSLIALGTLVIVAARAVNIL